MALDWSAIRGKYFKSAEAHWNLCETFGLGCPFDVFEQLFFDHRDDAAFGALVHYVDWSRIRWSERLASGVALRRIAVPRPYQEAVDEARRRTVESGVSDERDPVITSWEEQGTWLRAPVMVNGEVLGMGVDLEILVGFTRLGNLLGLLDLQAVPESQRHRVWVGEVERAHDD